MRLAILQTGSPPGELAALFPSYADMVISALGPRFDFSVMDVRRGELPVPDAAEGFLITGSPSGVHDGDAWIAELRAWLLASDPTRPLVGICFGHQIMAEAFGGRVDRAPKGWGVGFHRYAATSIFASAGGQRSFSIPAAHQDQVVEVPPAAAVAARSGFCPAAALIYGDRAAISVQGHPEFTPAYTDAVIDRRLRDGGLTPHQAQVARRSVRRGGDDRGLVLSWIRRFLSDGTALPARA
jgi:GMP synthase-like glutamine amidotransferase